MTESQKNGADNVLQIEEKKTKRKRPCPKKESSTEEECENQKSSVISQCSEISTAAGNLIDRIIYDPSRHRELALEQWPLIHPQFEDTDCHNPHQLKASMNTSVLNYMTYLRVDNMPHSFRQPAIIGTIGPACSTVHDIYELLDAGMNIARVSMAHIDKCNKQTYFQNVIEAANQYSKLVDFAVPVTTMMDLKGPEIRTGKIKAVNFNADIPEIVLRKGDTVRLTTNRNNENLCNEKFIYVDYDGLPINVLVGMEIYISNTKLRVESIDGLQVVCTVVSEGALRNHQQVHIPMLPIPLPAITEYDWECLQLAVELGVDIVVIPKTRNEQIVFKVKSILEKKEPKANILVFAKISNYEGVRNIDTIIAAADGIVIHKNDLALEIPWAKIFVAQKEIIAKCNKAAKPVVCCVDLKCSGPEIAQYILDGADSLLLTEETALGKKGPCAVETLGQIMREADEATMRSIYHKDIVEMLPRTIEPSTAITLAAVEVADMMNAAAIVTITASGKTAQLLSWFRPRCPVIAVTRFGRVARQLNMWRAVLPLTYYGPLEQDWFEDCGSRIRYGIAYGKEKGIIKPGNTLVLVTGYRKSAGFTNCLRVVFAAVNEGHVDNPRQYFSEAI